MGYCASGSGSANLKKGVDIEKLEADLLRKGNNLDFDFFASIDGEEWFISFWGSEKYHEDEVLNFLEALSPSVENGVIEYLGEDGCAWRFIQDQTGSWREENGRVVYADDLSEFSDKVLKTALEKRGYRVRAK